MPSTYDYIIVGAGSAGCVLANRLTADADVTVLLLEAGKRDKSRLLQMPIAWPMAAADPRFGWGYATEPEPQLNGRVLPLPRGRTLGGSSAINALRYSRGHPADYDQWRQMGLSGWGYADVLPYFKRAEGSYRGANPYHGADGPLNVNRNTAPELSYDAIAAATRAAGYVESEDIHGDVAEGLTACELTMDARGRRHNVARAYLDPILQQRRNLTLATGATVTRVRIENGRAIGIDYQHDGQTVQARAAREVILSGGAYNSPQLLMLSGVGPADELRAQGIAVHADVPAVGRNLAEHPTIPVVVATTEQASIMPQLRMDRAALWTLQWLLTGTGLFATNGNPAGLFVRTREGLDRPDVQLMFTGATRDAKPWWPGRGKPKTAVQCSISMLYPEATGRLTLRSANPLDAPRIQLNLFGAQSDFDTAVRAIRITRDVYAQQPLAGMITGEIAPGRDAQTDAELIEHVRRTAGTTQHPCCTCRMGVDDNSVVDATLKVRGVERLRVVDASVMPTIPGGHLNAPTIMIAEKASDMIRAGQ